MISLKINPMPKPRMTRADRWRKRPCVLRYWEFADELERLTTLNNYTIKKPLSVTFVIPMSRSWSAKKKALMVGTDHEFKPDLSNLIKALWVLLDILKCIFTVGG